MAEFTHFNENKEAVMVDISDKTDTVREAVATGKIYMSPECFDMVEKGQIEKGDVLSVARIAGIMGAKKTSELIPLCHMINLTKVEIEFELKENCVTVFCKAKTIGKTGVEMEALQGVQTALLCIYDMCKAVDKNMHLEDIHLCEKSGGKSGDFKYRSEA